MILNVTSITPFGGVVEVRPHVKVDVAVPGRDGGSLCSAQALCQTCEPAPTSTPRRTCWRRMFSPLPAGYTLVVRHSPPLPAKEPTMQFSAEDRLNEVLIPYPADQHAWTGVQFWTKSPNNMPTDTINSTAKAS